MNKLSALLLLVASAAGQETTVVVGDNTVVDPLALPSLFLAGPEQCLACNTGGETCKVAMKEVCKATKLGAPYCLACWDDEESQECRAAVTDYLSPCEWTPSKKTPTTSIDDHAGPEQCALCADDKGSCILALAGVCKEEDQRPLYCKPCSAEEISEECQTAAAEYLSTCDFEYAVHKKRTAETQEICDECVDFQVGRPSKCPYVLVDACERNDADYCDVCEDGDEDDPSKECLQSVYAYLGDICHGMDMGFHHGEHGTDHKRTDHNRHEVHKRKHREERDEDDLDSWLDENWFDGDEDDVEDIAFAFMFGGISLCIMIMMVVACQKRSTRRQARWAAHRANLNNDGQAIMMRNVSNSDAPGGSSAYQAYTPTATPVSNQRYSIAVGPGAPLHYTGQGDAPIAYPVVHV